MRLGQQLRCVAVLLLVAVSLVSCSDPVPAAKVPRSSASENPSPQSTSTSPSPSPSTPEQEVEAAVRTYYAELTRAAQTNDTSKLKQLMRESCPCFRAVRVIERGAEKGERTPELKWQLSSVKVHDVVGLSAAAEVEYRVTAHDVLDADGKTIERFPAKTQHMDLSMMKATRGWIVSNVFDLEG